jgi:tetratricopeptide (TPR) repeat protein
VISPSTSTRIAAITLSLLLFTAEALAGPGFIAETHVTRGSVYAEVGIRFRCGVQYLGHDPSAASDVVRIRLETTSVCTGAAPSIADTKELIRPMSADDASIESIEYDGESPGDKTLRISFSEKTRFDVRPGSDNNSLRVRVFLEPAADSSDRADATASTRLQRRPAVPGPDYVINLESWQRPPVTADMPRIALPKDKRVFVSEVEIDGATWYRVRVGNYGSAEEAARALAELRAQYPDAWIDRADAGTGSRTSDTPVPVPVEPPVPVAASDETAAKAAELMNDARRAMTVGELSRAVQIYTKVLQMPSNVHQPDAQEFLALARERNGQIAHAKAEYQRYLDVYPDEEGAERVEQRLAALLATAGTRRSTTAAAGGAPAGGRNALTDGWNIRTFLSQYYRRDANQVNDEEEIVSQSSIYSDISLDARRVSKQSPGRHASIERQRPPAFLCLCGPRRREDGSARQDRPPDTQYRRRPRPLRRRQPDLRAQRPPAVRSRRRPARVLDGTGPRRFPRFPGAQFDLCALRQQPRLRPVLHRAGDRRPDRPAGSRRRSALFRR